MLMNPIEKEIFDMYIREKFGCRRGNEYCKFCKQYENLAGPISFFHVGSEFKKDKYKIVFVGKNTWYDKSDYEASRFKSRCFADGRSFGRDSIKDPKSQYWKYIQNIIEKLYAEDISIGMERVAITNIVKCNTTGEKRDSDDNTPREIRQKCIDFGILEKEIQIMKPNLIIFLTGKSYDKEIGNLNFGCSDFINGRKTTSDNGNIIRWPRKLYHNGKLKYAVLRTSHPSRKKKKVFTNNIIKWIKTTEIP